MGQQQGTGWCGYYVCDYLHIMTPCGKATDEDMRVRPNRSLVHFHNCTNAHTTPAPLITAGSKRSSPPVLGGVGFKSLVMKGAITAGSQPDGDVPKPSPPVQQPAVLTPSRNKKKIVHAAAPLHLPHAAALHLPHAAAPLASRPPPLSPMPRKK